MIVCSATLHHVEVKKLAVSEREGGREGGRGGRERGREGGREGEEGGREGYIFPLPLRIS